MMVSTTQATNPTENGKHATKNVRKSPITTVQSTSTTSSMLSAITQNGISTTTASVTTSITAELPHRAFHRIRLDALEHNYSEVESAANRQRCSVIVVVKADGYGHGAIPTALHLADRMGAEAFAVATLEEGIALRKAFQKQDKELFPSRQKQQKAANGQEHYGNTSNNTPKRRNNTTGIPRSPSTAGRPTVQALFQDPNIPSVSASSKMAMTTLSPDGVTVETCATSSMTTPDSMTIASLSSTQSLADASNRSSLSASASQSRASTRLSRRPTHVRILVLGPPVGFPRCFDDYAHYNIECMVSGPEVATSLCNWVLDREKRQHRQVERAAMETKEWALNAQPKHSGAHVVLARQMTSNSSGSGNDKGIDIAKQNEASASNQGGENDNGHGDNKNGTGNDNSNSQNNAKNAVDEKIPSVVTTSAEPNLLSKQTAATLSGSSDDIPDDMPKYRAPAATLSNVTGGDLAKEVRAILMGQKLAAETQKQFEEEQEKEKSMQQQMLQAGDTNLNGVFQQGAGGDTDSAKAAAAPDQGASSSSQTTTATATNHGANGDSSMPAAIFAGIEEAAKMSRTRQRQSNFLSGNSLSSSFGYYGDGDEKENGESAVPSNAGNQDIAITSSPVIDETIEVDDIAGDAPFITLDNSTAQSSSSCKTSKTGSGLPSTTSLTSMVSATSSTATPPTTNQSSVAQRLPPMTASRKRPLRWHALVDSGMGRLGFRTDPPPPQVPGPADGHQDGQQPSPQQQQQQRRDTVDILQDLVQLEYAHPGVLEFYGMQTHMADASNALSNFTDLQVQKFKSLLQRVRAAGISVPTLSVDNSAALLTPSLQHFDPQHLLKQPDGVDSRGYVRVGGAMYGQRPFPQLKPVSTLYASVRHIATLEAGESVGYDRAYEAPTNGAIIATLTIGFADGYPRDLGKGVGKVSIRGKLYPVAGNVCMDMMMVYLGCPTDHSGRHTQIKVGDLAVLWGPTDDDAADETSLQSALEGVYMEDDRIVTLDKSSLPQVNHSNNNNNHNNNNNNNKDPSAASSDPPADNALKLAEIASSLKTTQSALTCGLNKTRVLRQYA